MVDASGYVYSADTPVVRIEHGLVTWTDPARAPLYFIAGRDFTSWLEARAIDSHRTNSRLLKKALRIAERDDAHTALAVNAVTITDNYWFCEEKEALTWNDVRFKENYFDQLALRGDPDSFNRKPSRTPELTNIGSFEKCWRLIDNGFEKKWWMYKAGTAAELFSELFIYHIGCRLGFRMALYEYDGAYIRTLDFTNGGEVNLEHISSVMGDNEDYRDNFAYFLSLSEQIATDYLRLIYLDALCFNMDRHTSNYGLLRDAQTGEILSLAPNYDNNIALIARGYPADVSRKNDGLIRFFLEFVEAEEKARELLRSADIPKLSEHAIRDCLDCVPDSDDWDRDYIRDFLLNGQQILRASFC